MITSLTEQDLIDFERNIAARFDRKEIKSPIHLASNTEKYLIEIFKEIKSNDYVVCTWRSHYQSLLKGVSKERLTEEIIAGHSIGLNFPEHRILSSGIVGGNYGIAVGLALSIKLKKEKDIVYCWSGDGGAETGAFYEAYKYSIGHDLPIVFIIESNGLSVCSPVYEPWGINKCSYIPKYPKISGLYKNKKKKIYYYEYKSDYCHAGTKTRVQF